MLNMDIAGHHILAILSNNVGISRCTVFGEMSYGPGGSMATGGKKVTMSFKGEQRNTRLSRLNLFRRENKSNGRMPKGILGGNRPGEMWAS